MQKIEVKHETNWQLRWRGRRRYLVCWQDEITHQKCVLQFWTFIVHCNLATRLQLPEKITNH